MGIFDRLFGNRDDERRRDVRYEQRRLDEGELTDEQAIARYRYLLRTAPPEAIEQAHAEAFAQLTPEQRSQVLRQLSAELPEYERAAGRDDPRSLARLATRAEMRQPGTVERALGGGGYGGMGGVGLGGMMMGSLLASVAGAFVGTAIADAMFDGDSSAFGEGAGAGDQAGAEGDYQADELGQDVGAAGEAGDLDAGGGFGGDFGGEI